MAERSGKQIVIAGATGLIGSRLVERLAARGDRVVALVRDVEQARRKLPGAAEHIEWSSRKHDGLWRERIDGADAVINLAGSPIAVRWTEKSKRAMWESRVEGTRAIVEAIRESSARPPVLINGSAVGYYGAAPAGRLTENSPAGDDFLARLCVEWEGAARDAEKLGVRVVLIRTGIVLANEGGAFPRLVIPYRLFIGGPIASGRQPFPWIHIEDEIGIVLWAIDTPDVSGPLDAVAPGILGNREFGATLGRVLRRPSFLPVPKLALDILFGEGSIILTGGQHAAPVRTESLDYRFRFPAAEPALRDLLGRN